jgi:HD-GYP domain-containing protein (c-di-GMP phosphodiesterase class II)
MIDRGYTAISPGAIIQESLPDFRIYIRSAQGKYVLWALEGNKVSSEQLDRLSESGMADVFVDLEEHFKYEQYLENNLGKILENEKSPVDQKATIFSKVSTNVVKAAFETCLGMGTMEASAIQRTHKFVENALIFIKETKSLPALAKMIGHDYQTYEHATKVLWFTTVFLRNNPEVLELIEPDFKTLDAEKKLDVLRQCGVGALLHDIGKALIPQDILSKDGPLTEVEWEVMKRHPLNGLAMLVDTDIPVFVKKAILHHHEDFLGGGYPMNVDGKNINILARILRITDVFDAMTSRRPYKDPIPPLKAAQIMVGQPKKGAEDGDAVKDDRDQGMKRCFDGELLRKFIVFLGKMSLSG